MAWAIGFAYELGLRIKRFCCGDTARPAVDRPVRTGNAEIGDWGIPYWPEPRANCRFVGRSDDRTICRVALDVSKIVDMFDESHP